MSTTPPPEPPLNPEDSSPERSSPSTPSSPEAPKQVPMPMAAPTPPQPSAPQYAAPPIVPVQPAELTQDERTMAVLAHALQLAGWWIAPLVIFLTRRNSRFVSFHALQALLLQILFVCIYAVGFVVFLAVMVASIAAAASQGTAASSEPPMMMFLAMPLLWIAGLISWVLGLLAAILYSVKAGRGEWAGYPVLGNLARRILKIESA